MTYPAVVTGSVSVNSRGFGFLNFDLEGRSLSAFVAPPELNDFLAGDVVRGRLTAAADGRLSVDRLELEHRTRNLLFGPVVKHRSRCFLQVDREVANTDWPLTEERRTGDFLLCRVDGKKARPWRRINPDDVAIEGLLARYQLEESFSQAIEQQTEKIVGQPHQVGSRRDLREVPTITIDAASTRDIDDAISVLPAASDGGMRLLVSIADPTEFIEQGSPLDIEARARGTSTYLPGRVIPMLPHALSSERLSLYPDVDRLCLTVEMRLDPEGRVVAVDLYESIICSRARVTYDELAAWLEWDELSSNLEPLKDILPWLRTAAARLTVARHRRGGVRVSGDEAQVTLDETGAVTGTAPAKNSVAHVMVERFMVAANEAVASWLVDRGVPGAFRVHPEPEPEQVRDLASCAHQFGYEAGFGPRLTPVGLAAFDTQIAGAAAEPAIRSVMRRVLARARYTVHPGLHLGLAAPLYLHFTSPLRRYADFQVHRIIKLYLHGQRDWDPEDATVETLCLHLNQRARNAKRAEGVRRRMLMAEYMTRHIGEEFEAHITRIFPFGLVAQLEASLVEGLIPLDSLPGGPWRAGEVSVEGPEETLCLGMWVRVRVVATDPDQGRIEYALLDD